MRQTIKRPSVFIPDMFCASFDNYAVCFFRKKTSLILLDDSNSYYGSRFLINPSRETDVPITKLCDECDFLAHRFSCQAALDLVSRSYMSILPFMHASSLVPSLGKGAASRFADVLKGKGQQFSKMS